MGIIGICVTSGDKGSNAIVSIADRAMYRTKPGAVDKIVVEEAVG